MPYLALFLPAVACAGILGRPRTDTEIAGVWTCVGMIGCGNLNFLPLSGEPNMDVSSAAGDSSTKASSRAGLGLLPLLAALSPALVACGSAVGPAAPG